MPPFISHAQDYTSHENKRKVEQQYSTKETSQAMRIKYINKAEEQTKRQGNKQ